MKLPAEFTSVQIGQGQATLSSNKWSFLATEDEYADLALSGTVTLVEPATQFGFFGQSWSVWPDLTCGDQGFDAAILLRAGTHDQPPGQRGYRVQLSYKYQHVALVKYPDGGYLAAVPCEVKLNQPHRFNVRIRGGTITVSVDDREKLVYRDQFLPIAQGRIGVGSSSGAKVTWSGVSLNGTDTPARPAPPSNSQLNCAGVEERQDRRPHVDARVVDPGLRIVLPEQRLLSRPGRPHPGAGPSLIARRDRRTSSEQVITTRLLAHHRHL